MQSFCYIKCNVIFLRRLMFLFSIDSFYFCFLLWRKLNIFKGLNVCEFLLFFHTISYHERTHFSHLCFFIRNDCLWVPSSVCKILLFPDFEFIVVLNNQIKIAKRYISIVKLECSLPPYLAVICGCLT